MPGAPSSFWLLVVRPGTPSFSGFYRICYAFIHGISDGFTGHTLHRHTGLRRMSWCLVGWAVQKCVSGKWVQASYQGALRGVYSPSLEVKGDQ